VSTHVFPDDVWDAFANGAAQVLGGYKGDPLYDTVFASATASMDATNGWLSLADSPYMTQRSRVLSIVRG
jgi:hypothetical protein